MSEKNTFVCDYCGEEKIYTNEGNKNSHIVTCKTKKDKKHKAKANNIVIFH